MNLDIPLQKKQRLAYQRSLNTPILFYGGARGGGKSYLVRARELIRRLQHKNTKGLIVRKTFPELLSNHIRPFFKEYPQSREWYNKAEKTIYWPNGSTTEFSYLQHTDDVYTYQGREYEDISIDEVTQHDWEVVKILRASNRTTQDIKPTMFLTGNPGGVGHSEVKRVFVDRDFRDNENPHDYDFVQSHVWDNDALMKADPDYVKRLESLPDHLRRAYLYGDWDVFAGQVFSEFRRDVHVVRPFPVPEAWEKYISFDWGVNNPFCVNWYAVDPDGHIFMYRELYMNGSDFEKQYGTSLTPRRLAKMVLGITRKAKEEYNYCVADPSIWNSIIWKAGTPSQKEYEEGESIAEIMIDEGLNLIRGDNDRINGLNRVREALSPAPSGFPWLRFFESCVKNIRTLPALVYDEYRVEDVDTDGDDHGYDSLRYFLMSRPFAGAKIQGRSSASPVRMAYNKAKIKYEQENTNSLIL